MATGDISTRIIRADGWSAELFIAGFTSGATYAFGLTGNNAPGANTPYLTVVSEGYNSAGTLGTVTRTVYLTAVVRVPYSTATQAGGTWSGTFTDGETITCSTSGATAIIVGAQASGAVIRYRNLSGTPLTTQTWTGGTSGATFVNTSSTVTTLAVSTADEFVSSTGMTVRVALSDYIFLDDNTGAGKSGTAPTITIPASFVTNTGGGAQTSAALSAASVTQNSTAVYPVALGQWDHIAGVSTADRVSGTFAVAMNARHGFGVACVRFDATGRTSSANVNTTVATQTATVRSATGLYASAHVGSITTGAFTTGELVDLRARVYPVVGDAASILDTDSYTTANDEALGRNKATVVFNSTPKYAYVSTAGNDGTAVASTTAATAQASPFLSIGKAIQNDATVIRLLAGTHPAIRTVSSSRRTTNEWYVVQPAPGESSSTVIVQIPASAQTYKCQRLQFSGVKIQPVSTGAYFDGESAGNFLRFTGCVWDHNGLGTPSVPFAYASVCAYIENSTGDMGYTNWKLDDFSTSRVAFQFDGVQFSESSNTSSSVKPWFRVVACSINGPACFSAHAVANPSPSQNNTFFDFNKLSNFSQTNNAFYLMGVSVAVSGLSFCGNVLEEISGNLPLIAIGADSSSAVADNIIVWNNTLAGGRWNAGYNDVGATAYNRLNWSVKNNIFESLATKHDTFGTPNGNRTGGWPVLWGAGYSGNFSPHIASLGASGSFFFEFIGLGGYQPARSGTTQPPSGATNVTGYVAFTDRKAYTGSAGAGGGTYTLTATSPAITMQRELVLPFDLAGTARAATDAAGAYHYGSASSGFFLLF